MSPPPRLPGPESPAQHASETNQCLDTQQQLPEPGFSCTFSSANTLQPPLLFQFWAPIQLSQCPSVLPCSSPSYSSHRALPKQMYNPGQSTLKILARHKAEAVKLMSPVTCARIGIQFSSWHVHPHYPTALPFLELGIEKQGKADVHSPRVAMGSSSWKRPSPLGPAASALLAGKTCH
ncbi:hypothetical protein UY3_10330 [Chelonia mydas]|uniref:Uncharacterized protein n=1 Tax=Chelonia mydas TaxID=8469 RepID=M7B3R9_CHEMY|nr:hypothetical protein UY3_10330 [Chelonia mydas]